MANSEGRMPGYSGTPLIRKLGFDKPPMRIVVSNAPPEYFDWLGELPKDVEFTTRMSKSIHAAHFFIDRKAELIERLNTMRTQLMPDGFVWISWPKKASKVPTDITEDTIREIALPLGFVDVKVCAVSEIWSGLKLVIRKELR